MTAELIIPFLKTFSVRQRTERALVVGVAAILLTLKQLADRFERFDPVTDTRNQAIQEITECIDIFYNRQRKQARFGYLSPVTFTGRSASSKI